MPNVRLGIRLGMTCREPHRQIGIGRVARSSRLGGVVVSTLDQNAKDVGFIPALGIIFPVFIIPMTLVAMIDPAYVR